MGESLIQGSNPIRVSNGSIVDAICSTNIVGGRFVDLSTDFPAKVAATANGSMPYIQAFPVGTDKILVSMQDYSESFALFYLFSVSAGGDLTLLSQKSASIVDYTPMHWHMAKLSDSLFVVSTSGYSGSYYSIVVAIRVSGNTITVGSPLKETSVAGYVGNVFGTSSSNFILVINRSVRYYSVSGTTITYISSASVPISVENAPGNHVAFAIVYSSSSVGLVYTNNREVRALKLTISGSSLTVGSAVTLYTYTANVFLNDMKGPMTYSSQKQIVVLFGAGWSGDFLSYIRFNGSSFSISSFFDVGISPSECLGFYGSTVMLHGDMNSYDTFGLYAYSTNLSTFTRGQSISNLNTDSMTINFGGSYNPYFVEQRGRIIFLGLGSLVIDGSSTRGLISIPIAVSGANFGPGYFTVSPDNELHNGISMTSGSTGQNCRVLTSNLLGV